MYFKIQGTYFKIYALYFSRKTASDFQRLTKPQKFGFSTQMRAQKNHPKRNVHIPANRASFSPSRRILHTCRLCLQSSRMPLQKHRLTLSKRQVNLTTTFYISTF